VAQLSYRAAIARGIDQEMARDERVFLIGEDVGKPEGVFKTTKGLYESYGAGRVLDTPISEQAIVGLAMGAASAGLRPIAEMMFADFLLVCHDQVSNQIAKARYMTDGQMSLPLVIRFCAGGGLGFGAQHSQCVENWLMSVPGLKVVAPSTPADVVGLMAAAVRDDDPVMFVEHKGLLSSKGDVPDGEVLDSLGTARIARRGDDVTVLALGMMVPRALQAAEELSAVGIEIEVIDLRSLVPLDVNTVKESVERTGRLVTIEENPRLCGWGAELVSIIVEEAMDQLSVAPLRITTPHVPLPYAGVLESAAIPSVDRISGTITEVVGH
jgi:acetoin:2,6-dichlorophenolindophenol oxidoreductase subunit beta